MILSGKPSYRTRRNENLASNSTRGETPSRDQVIDGTNTEAECFSGVAAGIQQLLYALLHVTSPRLKFIISYAL